MSEYRISFYEGMVGEVELTPDPDMGAPVLDEGEVLDQNLTLVPPMPIPMFPETGEDDGEPSE